MAVAALKREVEPQVEPEEKDWVSLSELREWVKRYAAYYEHGYDMPSCLQWSLFHFKIYRDDGTLPDFMKK